MPASSNEPPTGRAYSHEEQRLSWPYTQGELAGMIGGSRQSVNRLLADLADQGLVRLDRDQLVVLDRDRLARTVER